MTAIEKYDRAVAKYLHRCAANNLQPATLENYSRRLSSFREFLMRTNVQQIGYDTVEAWRDELREEKGLQPSTVCRYLGDLSIFFSALQRPSYPEELRYAENYVSDDFYPRVIKKPYDTILPDDKVSLLWRNRAPDGNFAKNWPRNYAILMILLATKIRNGELLDLRLSDVDFHDKVLVVRSGKGRKYREVDLPPIAETALRLYLDSGIRPHALPEDDYLFGTTAAHKMGARVGQEAWHRGTRQWLSSLVERTVCAITGERDVRSHDLRHIGARLGLNSGENSMEMLQSQLGHSSLVVTQIYSDRLSSRRGRESARAVLDARDRQAVINQQILSLRSPSSGGWAV